VPAFAEDVVARTPSAIPHALQRVVTPMADISRDAILHRSARRFHGRAATALCVAFTTPAAAMPTDRRTFLKMSALAAASAAGAASPLAADAIDAPDRARDYIELRAYRLKPGASSTLLDGYLERAFIPALNRRGIRSVGVFTEPDATDALAVWVVIPHASLASVSAVTDALNTDPAVLAAGADYLSGPSKDNPAFDRIDSWLHLSFTGLPHLAIPALTHNRRTRVFELRVYESFSELKALKKIAMFNAGEIEVMQGVGLSPVFYGQALVGRDLPHLSYLLCSPDRDTHKANFQRFLDHPTWKRLVADPQYADTVSKITSRFLVPTGYSQI
jgi:NIPSNAP